MTRLDNDAIIFSNIGPLHLTFDTETFCYLLQSFNAPGFDHWFSPTLEVLWPSLEVEQ